MEEHAEMKLSLRAKFYLLTVPFVVALIALAALIMAPYSQVQDLVTQIKEGLAESTAVEGFARHYERQLRECAAFVLTGSDEHERLFEQAKQLTGTDLENWIAAEKRHTGDTPSDHAEELAAQNKVKTFYAEVNRSCDWAIALSRSGRMDEAIASLEEAVDGPSGSASIVGEALPEEEAQLNGYLDNLQGAVKSVTLLRFLSLESNVESMKVHAASVVLAERFARYYNAQVKESLVYIAGGRPQDEVEFKDARSEAGETLDLWEEQAGQLQKPADRRRASASIDEIRKNFQIVSAAEDRAVQLASSGDPQGALSYLESQVGQSIQSKLTSAIDREVSAQTASLEEDADYIAGKSRIAAVVVGILLTLLLLATIGGTVLLSRMVIRPIVGLRDAAERFGKGEVDVQVEIKSRDELGQLESTFNEMALAHIKAEDNLRKARDGLEVRVEERTHELADANEELLEQIEERERAERDLERLNEELLSINKELDDFAYIVSHDLKAPLRGIGSLATWLKTDYAERLDEEGKKQLALLLDRAKKMERLIESVLRYSRVGRTSESREPVDLNELVAASIEMIGPPSNVHVVIEGELPVVTCERTRIGQVLQNLIGNAVKFMDKPEGTVTISISDEGSSWRIAVADNGPGIAPEYHEKVFQIFQTISRRDDIDSTGIGLTLVKKIVEMHGGRVWLESNVGKGSTFFFTLPKE